MFLVFRFDSMSLIQDTFICCSEIIKHQTIIVLADWFAQNNVDDMMIFIQYLLLLLTRFVQLLTRLFHSNLEVCFTSAPS